MLQDDEKYCILHWHHTKAKVYEFKTNDQNIFCAREKCRTNYQQTKEKQTNIYEMKFPFFFIIFILAKFLTAKHLSRTYSFNLLKEILFSHDYVLERLQCKRSKT